MRPITQLSSRRRETDWSGLSAPIFHENCRREDFKERLNKIENVPNLNKITEHTSFLERTRGLFLMKSHITQRKLIRERRK